MCHKHFENQFTKYFINIFWEGLCIDKGDNTKSLTGTKSDVNRNSLSLSPFIDSLKKISLTSEFLLFFMCFYSHVYSPRQGQTTQWIQKFYDNRKAFSLCPYVASFRMISSKSDFIHSPRARAENPLGTNFWCQQKALTTLTICCKFQTNLLILILYTFFNVFPHVYCPGTDNPLWTKFWCQQKGLVNLPICCKFQKNTSEVWFYTHFYTCI